MSQHPALNLYIAMSLDGFIAGPGDNIEFLDRMDKPGEDYGYGNFISTIDTVIMGRRTYEKVLSFGIDFPHKGRRCIVLSKTKTGSDENVTFYNGPVEKLIAELKKEGKKNIFCDGGADVVQQLIKKDLVDSYTISVIPIILGQGIRLFEDKGITIPLKLVEGKTFDTGLVQLTYNRLNEN